MLLSIKEISKDLLSQAAKEIVANATNKDQNPSGRLDKALKIIDEDLGDTYIAKLTGPRFIYNALEIGRGATKNFTKVGKGLRWHIEKWLESRGKSKKLAYVIARSIHKKGTLLGRDQDMRFGRPTNTIKDILNKDFERKVLSKIKGLVEVELMKSFKL